MTVVLHSDERSTNLALRLQNERGRKWRYACRFLLFRFYFIKLKLAWWLSWLERRPVTAEVVGSSPIRVASLQMVIYSIIMSVLYSLRITIDAGVAELADAQDLKSCGTNLPYRFDSGRRHTKTLDFQGFFCCLLYAHVCTACFLNKYFTNLIHSSFRYVVSLNVVSGCCYVGMP